MSQKKNLLDHELDIDEIDRKINRKNTKIKTLYVEELKDYLGKMKKNNDEEDLSAKNFKKPTNEEENNGQPKKDAEFRYSTISDEIDNNFGYLNDSSYSSDQDENLVQENFFNFVKSQKDDDFYKELNKVLEKNHNRPKYVSESKINSDLKKNDINDEIDEEAFINNYRKTLEDKMRPDELEEEVKRVKVFFSWLAKNHGIYLFKKNENNIVVNVFHPNVKENKFSHNPKSFLYRPVDSNACSKNLELKIYFDSAEHNNLLNIDELDLFLTDQNNSGMLKSKESENFLDTKTSDKSNTKNDEKSSENGVFERLQKINPFKRIKNLSFTPKSVFRSKK